MSKYDRQIRLWSETGQGSLREARLLVLGVSAAATEMAKNVVLAGVGEVTIADDRKVTPADRGASFFMQAADEGLNRAEVVARLVAELNQETKVTAIPKGLDYFLQNPERLYGYTLVIASRLPTKTLERLEKLNLSAPLLEIDSFGFFGRLRCFFKLHTIVESHPESQIELHLHSIWPELQHYSDSIDFKKLSRYEHEHVPYIVLLIKAMEAWGSSHESDVPHTPDEKREFKNLVGGFARTYDQENVAEAMRNSWRVSAPAVPSGLQKLLSLDAPTTPFFTLVRALARFVKQYQRLPLSGFLPDMKSDTCGYTSLIKIYWQKSRQDFDDFRQIYEQVCDEEGTARLPAQKIELFCKNARHIRVVKGAPVAEDTARVLSSSNEEFKKIFVCMEAASEYTALIENDSWIDKPEALEWLSSSAGGDSDELRQIWSSGGGEIHSIAALTGGIAAQEVLKLAMNQYTPVVHTLVYDGNTQATHVFQNGEVFN